MKFYQSLVQRQDIRPCPTLKTFDEALAHFTKMNKMIRECGLEERFGGRALTPPPKSIYSADWAAYEKLAKNEDASSILNLMCLWQWDHDKRPFFRVWPGFLETLTRFKTAPILLKDIVIDFPEGVRSVSLELPRTKPVRFGDYILQTVQVTLFPASSEICSALSSPGVVCYTVTVELQNTRAGYGTYMTRKLIFGQDTGETFDERMRQLTPSEDCYHNKDHDVDIAWLFAAKLAVLVGLVAKADSDVELLTPLVLDRYQPAYDRTHHERYLEKSRKEGFYGWDLGKNILDSEQVAKLKQLGAERGAVTPHWRNAHWSHRWAGEGRKQLKVVFINGVMVNEDLATKIPHGYYAKETPKRERKQQLSRRELNQLKRKK